jgi:hypothetical protein
MFWDCLFNRYQVALKGIIKSIASKQSDFFMERELIDRADNIKERILQLRDSL